MSDTQLGYDYNYDEDFDDDESADENNNQNDDRDSGMSESRTHGRNNSFDTDLEIRKAGKPGAGNTPGKKNTGKTGKTFDPYKATIPTSRRAQSDPRGRKPPRRPNGGNKGTSARSTVSQTSNDVMMNRVLSANRKKATSLNNTIHELQQQCEELRIENKDLKRSIRIQDRDLRKLDGEEAELPMIMKRHSNEVNVLQEKYKKQREIATSLTENLRRADIELLKTKDKVQELQGMAKEKNLGERIELKNKVLDLQYTAEEKDNKISELNRTIMLQKKTHSRIVKEKNEKYEKVILKMKSLEEEHRDLQQKVKQYESVSDVNNIYSRRKVKDEKQMVLSPQNPISPLLKKLDEENTTELPHPKLLLLTENKEEKSSVKTFAGDRIDTMVNNRNEEEDSTDQSEVDETFLTQGRMPDKDCEKDEDFYNVKDGNNGILFNNKDSYPVIKENEITPDDEIHEKFGQLIIKSETPTKEESLSSTTSEEESPPSSPPLQEEQLPPRNDDEAAKARKLLLAKLQAIDDGDNPNDVTENTFSFPNKFDEKKPIKENKKPIFLMSGHGTDDLTNTEPLEEMFASNSKPDSGNSRSRRVPPISDSNLENGEENVQRKDSQEFRKADENLHQGLPSSYTSFSPQSSRSSSGHSKIFNDKPSRFEQNYSPTLIGNNLNEGAEKKSKKGGFALFDQFEDPFKNREESKQVNTKNESELFSKKPSSDTVHDLEEMFIL